MEIEDDNSTHLCARCGKTLGLRQVAWGLTYCSEECIVDELFPDLKDED